LRGSTRPVQRSRLQLLVPTLQELALSTREHGGTW
jgi:hypothetical protein